MTKVTKQSTSIEQFERMLFINKQMLALCELLYRQYGVLMTEGARNVNSTTGLVGAAFRLIGLKGELPLPEGFTVHVTSPKPGQFIRTCFFQGVTRLENEVTFKSRLPTRTVFFTGFAKPVAELLQRIEETPTDFPAHENWLKNNEPPSPFQAPVGFVKKIVAIQELPSMERYVAVFEDGTGIPVEKLAEQTMPVSVGGFIYADGKGNAEFYHKHLVH